MSDFSEKEAPVCSTSNHRGWWSIFTPPPHVAVPTQKHNEDIQGNCYSPVSKFQARPRPPCPRSPSRPPQCKIQRFPCAAKIFPFATRRGILDRMNRINRMWKQSQKAAGAPSGAEQSCHPVKTLPHQFAEVWLRLGRAMSTASTSVSIGMPERIASPASLSLRRQICRTSLANPPSHRSNPTPEKIRQQEHVEHPDRFEYKPVSRIHNPCKHDREPDTQKGGHPRQMEPP